MCARRCSIPDGSLVLDINSEVESELRDELAGLQPEEAAVLVLLRAETNCWIRLRRSRREREAAHAAELGPQHVAEYLQDLYLRRCKL
jgi:hypothetical protein